MSLSNTTYWIFGAYFSLSHVCFLVAVYTQTCSINKYTRPKMDIFDRTSVKIISNIIQYN